MAPKGVKIIRIICIVALLFLSLWGLLTILMPINPFLDDELRIVYNLKSKNTTELWGELEFMQEFPRVYLQLIKLFTSSLHYSYFSLRFPAYLLGVVTILFSWYQMNRMYAKEDFKRFLFVMVIVSSYTFTLYFTQVKQYTMEIFLSVLGIWQMMELGAIYLDKNVGKGRYALLCFSFWAAPYFSYTYPIVAIPIFLICAVLGMYLLKQPKQLIKLWFPLLLCAFSIIGFYVIDVSQLMKDQHMRNFWGHLMYVNGFDWGTFAVNLYHFFCQVGAGLVFNIFFAVFGLLGLLLGIRKLVQAKSSTAFNDTLLSAYATLLLLVFITLNLARKLPMGEPRLNAFTVPAIAMLVLYFFDYWMKTGKLVGVARFLCVLLYISTVGNFFTTCYAYFTHPMYKKRMVIYNATQQAVKQAQQNKTPILVTAGVAYPYDTCWNMPYLTTVPGDWVLKTFPAYDPDLHIPVYALRFVDKLDSAVAALPQGTSAVTVGDGINYRIVPVSELRK